MVSKNKNHDSSLSIAEAVETLSSIAEMEFPRDVNQATPEEIAEQNNMVVNSTHQHVKNDDAENIEKMITKTFRVILNYLKDVYDDSFRHEENHAAIERVKTIMVLAGEAAKKIDKHTTFFKNTKAKCVGESTVYRQLQDFYLNRIARRIDESVLSKWVLELTKNALLRKERIKKLENTQALSANHVFIDLDSVKKDTDYELFFLLKADGTRFFNPRLIRNIKLVCDFGESLEGEKEGDPFEKIKWWRDQVFQAAAADILRSSGAAFDNFLREARTAFRTDLFTSLNKSVIALMMASNTKNLLINKPVKSCAEYFQDFITFLRQSLQSDEYRRIIAYHPKKLNQQVVIQLDMLHSFCRALFTGIQESKEMIPVFDQIFQNAISNLSHEHVQAAKNSRTMWNKIAATYAAMAKLMKQHPNGPLVKVLEILQQERHHPFDPIGQLNIPCQLYSLYSNDLKIMNIRIPAPIYQESINHAYPLEEFKAFIREQINGVFHNKYLIINLQDRTSWREHSRCTELEGLQKMENFERALSVVTLAKDTEFYHQNVPYEADKQAEVFMKHFKENLEDENCGFYFPQEIKDQLFPDFVDQALHAVHRVFFGHKNVLTLESRLEFIEIFYLILQLKLIELTQPAAFSFVCKDGIDLAGSAGTQFYAFLKLLRGEEISDEDVEKANLILHAAPVLIRERVMIADRFNRMLNALKKIESVRNELGAASYAKIMQQAFGGLFKNSFLQMHVI